MPSVIRTSARVNAHFLIMSLTASIVKGRTLSPSPSSIGEGNSPMRSDRDPLLAMTGIFRTCSVKHLTLSLYCKELLFMINFIKLTTIAPRACVRTWNVTLRQACIEKMKFCILLMLADKIFTCVAPIVSVRVQALLATSI